MDDDMTHVCCRICGERWHESCEDDALIHVNNEHGIQKQLGLLVDGRDGTYSIPFTDELFNSEYDARTSIMRNITRMGRLSACITEAHPPIEETAMYRRCMK